MDGGRARRIVSTIEKNQSGSTLQTFDDWFDKFLLSYFKQLPGKEIIIGYF